MRCSICKLEGHNKRSCKENTAPAQTDLIQQESLVNVIKRRSNSIDFYTDNSILPSSADTYWLSHGKFGDIHGKWMLFYDRLHIDKEWAKMKHLYNESKLGNVISMKCSGAKENPRASDKNSHVIIIYCPDHENDIMSIGNSIVANLVDYSNTYIYYKSNIQTKEGTRATGQNVNHLYKIPTKPMCDTSCNNGGYYPSRREREKMDAASTKKGYCKCGRKDEEGSYGCTRYPSCINDLGDSGDDGFY